MRAVAVLSLVLALSSGMAWGGAEAAPLEHCVKAEAAYQAGDHTLEIEYYTRCIDDEGPASATRAIAHNNRGVAHLAAGDPDSAIADYEKALSLDSAYAMAYANRGMAQLAKGSGPGGLR
jgi:tetratricopeptide (TPR) repeat protein